MKLCAFLVLVDYLSLAAIASNAFDYKGEKTSIYVKNSFIVEVDSLAKIWNTKRDGETPHSILYRQLDERDIKFKIRKEYHEPDLFVGVSLTLTSAQDVDALSQLSGIQAIRPVTIFKVPKPVDSRIVTLSDESLKVVGRQASHIATGVDKVHAEKNIGKCIKIGVIDTGVDYNHPDLGSGIGKGFKIAGGYDFVGDNYDGTPESIRPSNDPMDCVGHGTTVMGVIGADPGGAFNLSGVAYGATLTSYKVFGCYDETTDEIIIDALLRGKKDRQDILSLSIGAAGGWSESSSAVVASRMVDRGIVVTIAAGNQGTIGPWYASSPAAAKGVISVASTDNTGKTIQTANVIGAKHSAIPYFKTWPLNIPPSLPIYALSRNISVVDDACQPLSATVPDLSPYLVIVRRGTCQFYDKFLNIARKGGKYALIYNDDHDFVIGESYYPIPAALIQAADGQWLVEQFIKGKNVTLTFPQKGGAIEWPDAQGGLISEFSSYGPSFEVDPVPSAAAPGGNILSLLPVKQGNYSISSGTSFSTPYVAASVALILAAKGRGAEIAGNVRNLLESTAKPVASSHGENAPLQTIAQQGAGQINVYAAIHSETNVWPAILLLNDTAHFKNVQKFTVRNDGKKSQSYRLTHVPAGTMNSFEEAGTLPLSGPVPLNDLVVSVSLSSTSFTLRPGQEKVVTARFTLNTRWNPTHLPVYSGFIKIDSSRDSVQVAYLGAGGSLKERNVLFTSNRYLGFSPPFIFYNYGLVQLDKKYYSFVGDDYPAILYRMAFGSASIVIDLVHVNTTIPNVAIPPRNVLDTEGSISPFFGSPRHPPKSGSFAKVKTVGNLNEFSYQYRHDDEGLHRFEVMILSTPTFSNGTRIRNGEYRVLIRALKVFGDRTKQEDYESWLSPIIGIDSTVL